MRDGGGFRLASRTQIIIRGLLYEDPGRENSYCLRCQSPLILFNKGVGWKSRVGRIRPYQLRLSGYLLNKHKETVSRDSPYYLYEASAPRGLLLMGQ